LHGGDFDVIRERAIAIFEETGSREDKSLYLMRGLYTTEGALLRFAKKSEARGYRAVVKGKLGDTFIKLKKV